jgi:hypothetical protein
VILRIQCRALMHSCAIKPQARAPDGPEHPCSLIMQVLSNGLPETLVETRDHRVKSSRRMPLVQLEHRLRGWWVLFSGLRCPRWEGDLVPSLPMPAHHHNGIVVARYATENTASMPAAGSWSLATSLPSACCVGTSQGRRGAGYWTCF